MTLEIGLAASTREWPERVHRHLIERGGGISVGRLMSVEQVNGADFDVLFIDDICSYLTPRLVTDVRRAGAEVIGVFAPEDGSNAKRRLLECGISDVVESDASPEEFMTRARVAVGTKVPSANHGHPASRAFQIGVVGSVCGVGTTEIAIGLARAVSDRLPTVLVDLDVAWASVAQRLGLPIHPGIRTAIDAAVHRIGAVNTSIQELSSLAVITGVADQGRGAPLPPAEVIALFEELASLAEVIVVDLGSWEHAIRGVLGSVDTLAVVGTGDPVGVARLMRVIEETDGIPGRRELLAVVNKVAGGGYRRSEIRRELVDPTGPPVLLLPFDRRVGAAAWDGELPGGGPFHKEMKRMGRLVTERVG